LFEDPKIVVGGPPGGRAAPGQCRRKRRTTVSRHGTDNTAVRMELPSFDDCPLPMLVASGWPKGAMILKEDVELSSAKVHPHDLAPGTALTVLDVLPLGQGEMKRAKVTVDSGPAKGKEGWMTMVSKNGKMFFYPRRGVEAYASELPEEALAAARAAFSIFDVDGSGSLSVEELREVLTRPGTDGSAGLSDEEVAAIIATFDVNSREPLRTESRLYSPPCAPTAR
jgi:hypothetical protein